MCCFLFVVFPVVAASWQFGHRHLLQRLVCVSWGLSEYIWLDDWAENALGTCKVVDGAGCKDNAVKWLLGKPWLVGERLGCIEARGIVLLESTLHHGREFTSLHSDLKLAAEHPNPGIVVCLEDATGQERTEEHCGWVNAMPLFEGLIPWENAKPRGEWDEAM